MARVANELIHETSPYLLQHAYNPVHWYAWGEKAFAKAKAEKKLILVSIGYAACHWCHVMEKESFEDEETAALMNEYFVNIKVDREERPDVDHIMMEAVQTITGSGGWPLHVFLTPDGKPFYGGTYFPPVRAYNRISWRELLVQIHSLYLQQKEEVEKQSDLLLNYVSSQINTNASAATENFFLPATATAIAAHLLDSADTEWGGFERAPKFFQTSALTYLLYQFYFSKHEAALAHVQLSLQKIIQGGIYDHVGGGFSRYSTDAEWKAPHFEKMLYDNALLIGLLSETYQATKNELYKTIAQQTIHFFELEMMHAEGAFFSSLDADSEGVEGKFYVWSKKEIDAVLQKNSAVFCEVFNITEAGNWEHTNVLWMPQSLNEKAAQIGWQTQQLQQTIHSCLQQLYEQRKKRVPPQKDDKIILSWNAFFITALCKAGAAFSQPAFFQRAEQTFQFLKKYFQLSNGQWVHSYRERPSKVPAFLDDYAALIQACIHLQEVTGNAQYLQEAFSLTETVLQLFSDKTSPLFYYTVPQQEARLPRTRQWVDGVTPSGNALMAENLLYLSVVFNKPEWLQQSNIMVQFISNSILQYPLAFSHWAMVAQKHIYSMVEIAIVGQQASQKTKELLQYFIPNKILQSSHAPNNYFELLKNKSVAHTTFIYICKNYECLQPREEVKDAISLLK